MGYVRVDLALADSEHFSATYRAYAVLVLAEQFGRKLSLMVLEPFSMLAPLEAVPGYQIPEFFCVVHFFKMGELMDDNVVNDRFRRHQELPVEVEIALLRTTTPTGFCSSYAQSAICDS